MEPEIRLKTLLHVLVNNPAVKIFAQSERELLVRWLIGSFPEAQAVRLEDELERELVDLLEAERDDQPPEDGEFVRLEERAKRRLASWVEAGFLHRKYDDKGLIVMELSAHTLRALDWLEKLQERKFVGADSKFKALFGQIKSLASHTNPDRQARLAALEAQRTELDAEIARLKRGEEDWQPLREEELQAQVFELSQQARELVSDFKEVERNFQRIAQDIFRRQVEHAGGKGDLLGEALGGVEALHDSSQGRSFEAFWQFLAQPNLQQDLHAQIDLIEAAAARMNATLETATLRNMERNLLDAGSRINRANQRLAERLRQVVTASDDSKHKQIMSLIADIHKRMGALTPDAPRPLRGIAVEMPPEIRFPKERPLRTTRQETSRSFRPPEALADPQKVPPQAWFDQPRPPLRKDLQAHADAMLARSPDGLVTLGALMAAWLETHDVAPAQRLAHCMAHFALLRSHQVTRDTEEKERVALHEGRWLSLNRLYLTKKVDQDAR